MEKIKVINKRPCGSLFHYAHFLIDCLYPEIVHDLYKYEVVRQKTIHQTLGNFSAIYTDVMQNINTELLPEEFNSLNVPTFTYTKNVNKQDFDKFKTFVFSRYTINPFVYDTSYPEVILIKRGSRVELIDDPILQKVNTNITTGKERREIVRIDDIEQHLLETYGDTFKSIYLETIPFEQQVKYFNNAKIIICAHGAGMSNAFFCKENTIMIEVTCGAKFPFFDKITNMNHMNHIKCKNDYSDIMNQIRSLKI